MNYPNIRFFEDGVEAFLFIPDFPGLKEVILSIAKDFNCRISSLNVIFTDDEKLKSINEGFLEDSNYTDVITFDLTEESGNIEGEIYISLYRVVENAYSFGVTTGNELARVILHGVLHLMGITDKGNDDASEMRRLESYYVNLLNTY